MPGKTPSKNQKSGPRSAKNKRPKTRQIVRWDTKLDLQLLLAIDKVCKDEGIKIPYDKCGPEVAPSVTGNAIVQHLAKLRKKIIDEMNDEDGKPVTNMSVDPDDSNESYHPENAIVSATSANKRDRKRNIKTQKAKESGKGGASAKKSAQKKGASDKYMIDAQLVPGNAAPSSTATSDTFDKAEEQKTEWSAADAYSKTGRKRAAWHLGSEDLDEDDEQYVAADSSLVIKEEVESETDEQELADPSDNDVGRNSPIILRIPDHLRAVLSSIESGAHRVSSVTASSQHAMGSLAAPAQTVNNQATQNAFINGMYDFDPTFFPSPTAIYPASMQLPMENDTFLGGSYDHTFFDQGLGFPDIDFSNFQATFADFGPAQPRQLGQGNQITNSAVNAGPTPQNGPGQQVGSAGTNVGAATPATTGRRAHQRNRPVDVRRDFVGNPYDISGNYRL